MTPEELMCSVCGAALRLQQINYLQTRGDAVYLVAEVPAQTCAQCGEQYLSPETVDAIQEAIEHGRPQEMRAVPVYHLAPAAR